MSLQGGEAPCFAHLHAELALGAEKSGAFGQLVRDLADAVIIADSEGTIVFWNGAATKLFGWREDDAVGRSLDMIIPERLRDRHWDGYRRVMETGHTQYQDRLLEVPAQHRDGHTISIAFTVTLLFSAGEAAPAGIAAVLRDDTARRRELRDRATGHSESGASGRPHGRTAAVVSHGVNRRQDRRDDRRDRR